MGITLEDVLKQAEELKESIWYLLTCKDIEGQEQKDKMNALLDSLDELR
jgi:hypothetical protein